MAYEKVALKQVKVTTKWAQLFCYLDYFCLISLYSNSKTFVPLLKKKREI